MQSQTNAVIVRMIRWAGVGEFGEYIYSICPANGVVNN